jgi:hypothetical protein
MSVVSSRRREVFHPKRGEEGEGANSVKDSNEMNVAGRFNY